MKKILFRAALVSAVVVFGGCGGTSSSNSDTSEYASDSSSSDYESDSSNSDYGYTSEIEDNFVNSCTSNGGGYSECTCMYEYIKDNMSYEEFMRIDNEMNNGSDASEYPVLVDALDQCI